MKEKYDIQYTNKFKKQYSKLLKNSYFKKAEFEKVLAYLINNEPLHIGLGILKSRK